MRFLPSSLPMGATAEWLETDGLGGFASGTIGGIRTRRYHALLMPALNPPSGRVAMVNAVEVDVQTREGRFPISAQHYAPGITVPREAVDALVSFDAQPWPTWRFMLPTGHIIRHELFVEHGSGRVALMWCVESGRGSMLLRVRPLIAGRDYHGLQRENISHRQDAIVDGERVEWRPYEGLPPIQELANASYVHEPVWYRSFMYEDERARGLDHTEDLASPGVFTFDVASEPAVLVLGTSDKPQQSLPSTEAASLYADMRKREETRRALFATPLHRAGDQYLVRRGTGHTIIAGYPWFTDWGRDTFIALRGLCLATGRLDEAVAILSEWAGHVSEGMLPNRFPDNGERPEFNSVDASLWYILAAAETLDQAGATIEFELRRRIVDACLAIGAGYRDGTRHHIAMDPADGLIRCGEPGVQLTWMDAKVGDWVVTPRIGKPVEIQALWINALSILSNWDASFEPLFEKARASFTPAFWNEERGCLYDVVDDNHVGGAKDARLRPNQIFAAGGLPITLVDDDKAASIIAIVEGALWTPMGLRSLGPAENGYVPTYMGGVWQRDGAYHQGTVWPWLMGGFVDAWVKVNGSTDGARAEASRRFVEPMAKCLSVGSHLAEIADGQAPHVGRGCPFQAWSVGELLRLQLRVLAPSGLGIEAVR